MVNMQRNRTARGADESGFAAVNSYGAGSYIYLYGMENFGQKQAERYYEAIIRRIDTAAEHPGFGKDYGFVREGLPTTRQNCAALLTAPLPAPGYLFAVEITHFQKDCPRLWPRGAGRAGAEGHQPIW